MEEKKLRKIWKNRMGLLLTFALVVLFLLSTNQLTYARSLYRGDFTKISENGFGDPGNSYGWSSAWFKGKLYVGTERYVLEMMSLMGMPAPNVDVPESFEELISLDLAGEIWEYTPNTKQWRLAFKTTPEPVVIGPPFATPPTQVMIPKDNGYRAMLVHDGALYITTVPVGFGMLSMYGLTPRILKTTDGVNFTPMNIVFDWDVMPKPAGFISSYRSLVPLNGKFYTAPAEGGTPIVFEVTIEGDTATFRPASFPAFGNPDNTGIFDLAKMRGCIYAGTMNYNGYEVYRSDVSGGRPYNWTRIIENGAGGGEMAGAVLSMYEFKNKMYVGTGMPMPIPGTYPSLIRIWPNGYWQIVCGDRVGWKWPISGMKGGFDNIFTGYVWRMIEHDGWLYAGTYDVTSSFLPYIDFSDIPDFPPILGSLLQDYTIPSIRANQGGFDLWKSWNGRKWYQISQTGFGNPLNYGVRSFTSSPEGLFLCTANAFTQGDTAYNMGYEGGTEVWLGRPYFRILLENPPDLIPTNGSKAAPTAQTKTTLEFAALESYPNPANPEVWIPYQLPYNAEVSIDIHSVNGQLIKTIQLGNQEPGVYMTKDKAAYWDGTNLAGERVTSGIYFYTLKAGEFAATKKITIAK
ncbi:T9SS type A sorting domain-containing protein [Candidatus Poribacteria bacterium]|nr:T9SS type A sorting domain-containing protein [Candidatus Poribacteria bacterium]